MTASVDTQVVEPNLVITKTPDALVDVFPGDSVTYTLLVTNVGGTRCRRPTT